MTSKSTPGVVAAGHPATAAAGREILLDGGNAFDAAVAACFAACVAEPLLASLGGGGFLLARSAEGSESLYDFFGQTPLAKRRSAGERGDLGLEAIECDYGDTVQIFHIGQASVATPGLVKGLFAIHRDLGTMPMTRLVEPAVELARGGVRVDEVRAFTQRLLRLILVNTAESRRLFAGKTTAEGRLWRTPELAEVLSALAVKGEDFFYRGELGRALASACADSGHLTLQDLRRYEVVRRQPLVGSYRGHRWVSNPAPSVGGSLIAFALCLLEEHPPSYAEPGSARHMTRLACAMELTNEARAAAPPDASPQGASALLDDGFLEPYRSAQRRRLASLRGTTHLSVVDGDGNLAGLSVSNGEGCGFVLPGTGIMLNNFLGEEDLHLEGLGHWPENRRLASMMAPTLIEHQGGRLTMLGSGGSNRLRTAILQVLVNLLDFELPLAEAIRCPRIHREENWLDVEPGWPEASVDALAGVADELRKWERCSLYFGGVHAAELDPRRSRVSGAGDPRRGGVVRSTEDS